MSLVVDLGRALAQIGDPRFRAVLWKALALTLAALALVTVATVALLGWAMPDTVTLPWIGTVGFVDSLVSWAAIGVMLALSVVLMVPTAAAVVGFFLDDVAEAVEARHYPNLPPARPLRVGQQVGDALRFLGLVLAVNLAALVVYLTVPPLAPFVFWSVNGFLLGREYFQLVALRRLPKPQAESLWRSHFWRVWIAGTLIAVPLSIPILNLAVPILGVAVFVHQVRRLAPPPGAAQKKTARRPPFKVL